jgi:hypothetical protein
MFAENLQLYLAEFIVNVYIIFVINIFTNVCNHTSALGYF